MNALGQKKLPLQLVVLNKVLASPVFGKSARAIDTVILQNKARQ
jgi:hypothetical protein